MNIQVETNSHGTIGMSGMEVSVQDRVVTISEGVFYFKEKEHHMEEIKFTVKDDADSDIIYDLYIVEDNGAVQYDLFLTYPDDETLAFYDGKGRLIHTFVNVHIRTGEEGTVKVYRLVKPKNIQRLNLYEKTNPEYTREFEKERFN